MPWFRQDNLAEMMKDLEEQPYEQLLDKIVYHDNQAALISSWTEWFDWWQLRTQTEKSQLLHHIFAVYRNYHSSEWWSIWLLMFEEELRGIYQYYQGRIRNSDECWSIIIWTFMEVLTNAANSLSTPPTIEDICTQIKQAVNKSIRHEYIVRQLEINIPNPDAIFHDSGNRDYAHDEHDQFSQRCRYVSAFLKTLSRKDMVIIEEICFLGHSFASCARRLGLSRYQVDRRFGCIKAKIAKRLQLPLAERIFKR